MRKHKYKKEKDWGDTYEAVLYRYNQADLDARKEFGVFYKFKIENEIRRKSKSFSISFFIKYNGKE